MEEKNTSVEEQVVEQAQEPDMVEKILGNAMPGGINTQEKINKILGIEE